MKKIPFLRVFAVAHGVHVTMEGPLGLSYTVTIKESTYTVLNTHI